MFHQAKILRLSSWYTEWDKFQSGQKCFVGLHKAGFCIENSPQSYNLINPHYTHITIHHLIPDH